MSFSAKADVQDLWSDMAGTGYITAVCIFPDEETNSGSIYLMTTNSGVTSNLVPLYRPIRNARTSDPSNVWTCKRQVKD
tara:strand:+ start:230 stop:466 length:237 start_codon:yes stop_codon:yes gene_type:complete